MLAAVPDQVGFALPTCSTEVPWPLVALSGQSSFRTGLRGVLSRMLYMLASRLLSLVGYEAY